ncbi:MAG: hypothetical protein RLZ06_182 [Actinomycetota bacterium]|jgi:hypothetical protein
MAKVETFLRFGKETEAIYSTLNDRAFSGKLSNIQLFMLACSFGFGSGRRVTDFQRANNGPRTTIRDEHLAFLSCLLVSVTGNADSLMESSERDKLAEEFAEGGIRLLQEKLSDPTIPSFITWMISEMKDSISSNLSD